MSTNSTERFAGSTTAPKGMPLTVYNHFVYGPSKAIADREPEDSVLSAVREYLVQAWDQGCAPHYADSREALLTACSTPSLLQGDVTRRCEDLLADTLRRELAHEEVKGHGMHLMASQIFSAIRVVVEEMRAQVQAEVSLDEASKSIRAVVAESFDQLERGLSGVGVRAKAHVR